MGIGAFLLYSLVVVVLVYLFTVVIDKLAPGHPVIINQIAWGVAVLIIVALLVQATGLSQYDPKIPSF